MKSVKTVLGFLLQTCVLGARMRLDCARRRAGLPP